MTDLVGLSRRLRYYYTEPAELHLEQSDNGLTVALRLPISSQ